MTNMNEAAKRAAELANERISANRLKYKPDEFERTDAFENCQAFARFIQHVSDVAQKSVELWQCDRAIPNEEINAHLAELRALILPKPVDPLAEAISDMIASTGAMNDDQMAHNLRAELAKRGLVIVPMGDKP